MTLDPIRAWFETAKLYIFGALLIAAGFAYWYHGHVEYKAGKLAGDKEVAALKAQYATASQKAAEAAKALQAQYDAQALADAQQRAQAAQAQIAAVQAKADSAQHAAAQFQAALKEARKHDPTVASWLDSRIPSGVQSAGQGHSG